MAAEEIEKQEGTSLFGRIVDAIARRSALIKQQEADYTALVVEKDLIKKRIGTTLRSSKRTRSWSQGTMISPKHGSQSEY